MMPGSTKAMQARMQKQLAYDLRRRVHGRFEQAYKKFIGDLEAMNSHFSQCVDATIACYSGKCGKPCNQQSLV